MLILGCPKLLKWKQSVLCGDAVKFEYFLEGVYFPEIYFKFHGNDDSVWPHLRYFPEKPPTVPAGMERARHDPAFSIGLVLRFTCHDECEHSLCREQMSLLTNLRHHFLLSAGIPRVSFELQICSSVYGVTGSSKSMKRFWFRAC